MPRAIILAERCKGCLLCTTVCPVKILRRSTVVNSQGYAIAQVSDMSLCTGCGSCALICPDMAIRVFAPEKQERGA
ncbi:4Fe-4S binding protein [Desulfovibrio cuneatus]|uniref:4Fe-4S binding protein n=1 Tax=Desulfovibrio cuneatus TaxID=159728 RepID=UPI000417E4B3|nr:4Fe-4S binding protein [Desulfovibrio cuneatus]